jgi:hypothetical protein
MFVLGYCMAHVMVPSQAASMAQIDRASTGRASTLFNAVRQLGSATGIAVLSTVLSAIGFTVTRAHARGPQVADLAAYHWAFAVAAAFAFVGAVLALSIHDEDADSTRTARRPREEPAPATVVA